MRSSTRANAPSLSPGLRRAEEPPQRDPDESPSDGELIRRIAERDSEAFDGLYQRFARPVLALSLRKLRDQSRAEDATQETFLAIWRSAASYQPEPGPGGAWLYAVARNAIVDQTRKRSEFVAEAADSPSEAPGPPERAESEWVRWRIHRALEELPEHQRTQIELAYWSELSQTEIATRLGLPLGTVKTRTRSALTHLAKLLENEELR
jgi:RNA polymerase sigma-70 factor (ECF subfamily)